MPDALIDWWTRWQIGRKSIPAITAFVDFTHTLTNDGVYKLAAMLAYYLLMSLLPTLVMLFSFCGFILNSLVPHAQEYVKQGLIKAVPQAQPFITLALNRLARGSLVLALMSTLVSAYFGARLFVTIEYCFGIIFRVPGRPFLRKWLMGLGMLVLFVLVIPVLLVVSALPSFLSTSGVLVRFVPPPLTTLWIVILSTCVGWGMAFLLFLVIYGVIPNRKRQSWELRNRFREGWKGAAIAATLLIFYLIAFPLYAVRYLDLANDAVTAAVVLVVLVFFYFFGLILLLGAEITAREMKPLHPQKRA